MIEVIFKNETEFSIC